MSRIARFNEWLAVKATNVFGSMGMTYLFFGYGFVPALVPSLMVTLLYWSNTIQLWSLPLLLVGTNAAARGINALIRETHDTVMKQLTTQQEMTATQTETLGLVREEMQLLRETHDAVVEEVRLLRGEPATAPVRAGESA
ncbi:hypothetical protein ABIA32_002677 [Streptacidiphilus sp. MAP12-20]|uniref:hypothetical protein n=1 Tax=Streptacidiphilus sp. MAP12-20 TaxID=3156299 RepID=UPI0035133AA5